jgi:hypothetical protein
LADGGGRFTAFATTTTSAPARTSSATDMSYHSVFCCRALLLSVASCHLHRHCRAPRSSPSSWLRPVYSPCVSAVLLWHATLSKERPFPQYKCRLSVHYPAQGHCMRFGIYPFVRPVCFTAVVDLMLQSMPLLLDTTSAGAEFLQTSLACSVPFQATVKHETVCLQVLHGLTVDLSPVGHHPALLPNVPPHVNIQLVLIDAPARARRRQS